MRKWMINLICLLAAVGGGFVGCSEDKDFNEDVIIRSDFFSSTEGEKIDFVLNDVPAYIHRTGRETERIDFCYANYAYEFFEDRKYLADITTEDEFVAIETDIMNKRITVQMDEFLEYNIPDDCKLVYLSADVTNIACLSDYEDWQFTGVVPLIRKAYLTGLRIRNE